MQSPNRELDWIRLKAESDPGELKEKGLVYLVEPRVMEDIKASLMDDGGTVALRRGERSGR